MKRAIFLIFVVISVFSMLAACSTPTETPGAGGNVPTQLAAAGGNAEGAASMPDPTETLPQLTPTPQPAPITVENAGQLVQSKRFGEGMVRQVVFSPDGSKLAVLTTIHLALYEVPEAKILWQVETNGVQKQVVFSQNGTELATLTSSGAVTLWDAVNGELKATPIKPQKDVDASAISPDGGVLAASYADSTIKVIDAVSGKEMLTNTAASITRASWDIAVAPDNQSYLSLGSTNPFVNVLQQWGVDGEFIGQFTGVNWEMTDLSITPDGSMAGAIGRHRLASQILQDLFVWKISDRKLFSAYELGKETLAYTFMPDGRSAVVAFKDGSLTQLELKVLKEDEKPNIMGNFVGHDSPVISLSASPDGKWLASASIDGKIILWDAVGRSAAQTIELNPSLAILPYERFLNPYGKDATYLEYIIPAFALSPDGKRIASSTPERKGIRIVNALSGEEAVRLGNEGSVYYTFTFSHDGKYLAAVEDDSKIVIFDSDSGSVVNTIAASVHNHKISRLKFSPDDKNLASLSCEQLYLWDVNSGEQLKSFGGYLEVDFSADGNTLVSDNIDYGLYLWDIDTGKKIASPEAEYIGDLAYSPDGTQLAVAGWQIRSKIKERIYLVYLHDATKLPAGNADETAFQRLPIEMSGHLYLPYAVIFSPDGKMIASADAQGNVYVWDATTGALLKRLDAVAYTYSAKSWGAGGVLNTMIWPRLAFTADNQALVVGSGDGSIHIFEVQ
jgi:WD40 repeat protein